MAKKAMAVRPEDRARPPIRRGVELRRKEDDKAIAELSRACASIRRRATRTRSAAVSTRVGVTFRGRG
jgi:hypothetical protein